MAKMNPLAKKLYTQFDLTIPQAKAIAKLERKVGGSFGGGIRPSATAIQGPGMKGNQGRRIKSASVKAERGRTTTRASKKK